MTNTCQQHHSLTINVNDQFTIDAGSWQECVEEDRTPYRLVSPPHTTMYRQVLSYLEETTRNERVPAKSQLHFGEVAIATVALCIRWGSYFAVLTNRDLPQWAAAFDPEVSCIGDGEMARINIEASAALSDWIDLMRADQPRFRKLVKAAVQLLPFPIAQLDGSTYYHRFRAFSAFNSASGRRYLMEAFAQDFGSEWFERRRRASSSTPHAPWPTASSTSTGATGRVSRTSTPEASLPRGRSCSAASPERRKRC